MDEATESILIPASCSTLPSREISLTRCWATLARYAETRIMPRSRAVCRLRVVAGVKIPA